MNTKQIFYLLFFSGLAISACTYLSQASQAPDNSSKPNLIQPENVPENESTQDILVDWSQNSDGTRLLVNMFAGYCIRYPAEYDIALVDSNRVMFFKGSYMNTSEPNAYIDVQVVNGMNVEHAADRIVATFGIPGEEVTRVELFIGGEKAIMLDNLSGQDPNRQVVVIHQDTLYTLYFMLVDKSQSVVSAQAEVLYKALITSLKFATDPDSCSDG